MTKAPRETPLDERSAAVGVASASSSYSAPRHTAPPLAPSSHAPPRPVQGYALFREFPTLAAELARVPLTDLPTPVERLPALESGPTRLYVKRDDKSSQHYGGGKPRKLELLLADAQKQGARRVISVGAVGSHHALATTLFARRLGLAATVYLLPQPPDQQVRENLLALHALGANMRSVGSYGQARRKASRQLQNAPDESAYFIPAGGTSALSTIAFVNAGLELAQQVRRGEMPEPQAIYVAMGTMGSAVGIALGAAAAGLRSKVVAVRVSSPGTSSRNKALRLARATVALLRQLDPTFPALALTRERFIIDGSYLGRGYGLTTLKGARAISRAEKSGLILEPSYTAKTMAAVLDAVQKSRPGGAGRVILYWHSHAGPHAASQAASHGEPSATAAQLPVSFRGYFAGSSSRR